MLEKIARIMINPEKVVKGEALGELPSSGKVLRRTIRLGWPSVFDAVLASIVGLVDMQMVSCLGTEAIASIGLTNQPKFIVLCFFMAMNIAISAVVSRRYGQNLKEEANFALNKALMISAVAVIILSAIAFLVADPFMKFSGSDEFTHSGAVTYFRTIMCGTFFFVLTLNINGAHRAIGKTKVTMITNVTANLVNLVFNYLLIEGRFGFPRLGVMGAGIATCIGWFVAFVIAIVSLNKKDYYLRLSLKKMMTKNKQIVQSLFKVFNGAILEQLCIRVGFYIFAIIVANLGHVAFATHNVVMGIITITFGIGDGLSIAASSLMGQNLGKKRSDLSEVYLNCCKNIGILLGIVCCVIFILFGHEIITLFDSKGEIGELGYNVLLIASPILIFQIVQLILNGALRGAGDVKYVAKIMLISVAIIRPISGYVLAFTCGFGLYGIWFGFLFDQTIRLVLSARRLKSGIWKTTQV